MGLLDLLRRLFGLAPAAGATRNRPPTDPAPGEGLGLDELARRLGVPVAHLRSVTVAYRQFSIPKRSGGTRTISAPQPQLKQLQRTILRRLLRRVRAHPTATGFERGLSIATNAGVHARAAVVLRMDVRDFFGSTSANRVLGYFYAIGWGAEAGRLLTSLCTHEGRLPQGAPTSPRLSNLVNYELDARLTGLAQCISAAYTRYADDMTFSFRSDDHEAVYAAIRVTKKVLAEYGYRLHHKRKLSIRRRHQSQRVTGLVVNDRPALPRKTRRWLRAVRHHLDTDRTASLTPAQLAGWDALTHMIQTQSRLGR